MVCSPSLKRCQGIVEDIRRELLVVHHRVFMEEREVILAKWEVLERQLCVIQDGIDCLDKEIVELDEE